MSDNLLPSDMWQIIGSKLDPPDLIRFRAVSKSLRSLLPLPPLLLLSPSDSESSSSVDAVYVGGDQRIFRIFSFPRRFRCVGSTGNWLITAHKDKDKTIRLLNPFSNEHICLPSQPTFEHGIYYKSAYEFEHLHLWKVILSGSPKDEECVAMAVHNYRRILAIARLGDAGWTTLRIGNDPVRRAMVNDVIFFKGRFLAVDTAGRVLVCQINRPDPKACYLTGAFKEWTYYRVNYLVEWCDRLLLVIKWLDKTNDESKYRTNRFEVYKFDCGRREWVGLKSLGEHSLFLGCSTSISVRDSDYFGFVRKNSIYFTDDFYHGYRGHCIPGGRDMGVFNLEDGSIKSHFSGVSTSPYSPPLWIVHKVIP